MELKIKGVSLIKCTLSAGEREVVVPRGVRVIEWAAFSACSNLRRVVLPDGLFEIGRSAFRNCQKLTEINLPDRLHTIGEGAFADCSSLRSISLPDSVQSMGTHVFENCSSLVQIKLPANLKRIEDMTFHNCRSLQKIHLPESIREIGLGAFQACASLVQMRCPDSTIFIGERAFRSCLALRQIKLPETMQHLGDQAFANCIRITSLILPEGIVRLPERLCKGCAALTQVVLPTSLDNHFSRGTQQPFENCRMLTRVIVRGVLCESVRESFYGLSDQLQQLYVSSPDAFEEETCFSGGIHKKLMLLALRTYAADHTRFSPATQKKYHSFINRYALQLCPSIIEHADVVELICSNDLLDTRHMKAFVREALEKPAQLGRLLRYVCGKKTMSKATVLDLIDKSTALEQNEATAVLLEYKNAHYPAAEDDDDDLFFLPSLDDDDF